MTISGLPLSDISLDEYDYADDPLLKDILHEEDRKTIARTRRYGRHLNDFGLQMVTHQNRVAKDGAAFLKYLGYSTRAARNFRAAMLFHDIGKMHSSYNPSIWSLEDRPTPEQKTRQKLHARFGAEMLDVFSDRNHSFRNHPHYTVRRAVTLLHHERVDGTGPEELNAATLPVFVQVSCIVDSYDGDMIYRPHQERRRTPREVLRRLAGIDDQKQKYEGAFDQGLLRQYIEMKERIMGMSVLS